MTDDAPADQSGPGGRRRDLGAWGEEAAVNYLSAAGYAILARNWRYGRHGEVDIIARQGETLVFVEVRTRRGVNYGPPEASITPRKAARMKKVALGYIGTHGLDDVGWRLDVVAVIMDKNGKAATTRHHVNVLADWS